MSNESHPSPTGSSSFGGGGGANEILTQPTPAKPTWAQILNSNTRNNSPSSSSSPSSQHSTRTKQISPATNETTNVTGTRNNFYEQPQSQSKWPLTWMSNDDDAKRQQTNDNTQTGGDGFDQLESISPTSDWNKPVTTNNSTSNGWPNFQQQTHNNPSRSNPNNNQWPDMNNLSHQNNENISSMTQNQDSSTSNNTSDTLALNNNSKHKSSSIANSLTGALKSAIALSGGNGEFSTGNNETMINYVPQPKLVKELGWDEPDINVVRRVNFDDGTSIWGDPIESMSIPVKKWTNGTKSALTNSTNIIVSQDNQQQTYQKQMSTTTTAANCSTPSSSLRMMLNDENLPQQQSPTIVQQTETTNLEQTNLSSCNSQTQLGEEWLHEDVINTSEWDHPRPAHRVPFDPSVDLVDTTIWDLSRPTNTMSRNHFHNEQDIHDIRMSSCDNPTKSDSYRQHVDLKNSMMGFGGILPPNHQSFQPRPNPIYPPQTVNMMRANNPNGGLSTPPGAIHLSPKLSTSSPVPSYGPLTGKQTNIPNPSSQTPTPSQQTIPPNVNNNNNSTVQAQIMQQFRLAVQAGLISQDLLNTKLPPYMLQLLQRLFEYQQKYQQLSYQLSELSKNKGRFPIVMLQNECERLSKLRAQKQQDMLIVQKEIQDAHTKLKQQTTNQTPTPTHMMNNGPILQNPDQSRLNQWTKHSTIGAQRTTIFPPPGLTQKDWQTDNNDPNENWNNTQTNESNNNNNNNQVGNVDLHLHGTQPFSDPFSNIVDDIDGPPPFVPGQLWNWKSPIPSAEDDPHVTPNSFSIGSKGSPSLMNNLNVRGAESAFSNPQLMHSYPRQLQSNRTQWQHDQQGFQSGINDWPKQQQQQQQQQNRGMTRAPPTHHPSFGGAGGYRPYM